MNAKESPPSWIGLSGCLGGGLLVILLIIVGVGYVRGKAAEKKARVSTEWLTPYLELIREGAAERAWETLTTERYREQFPQEKYSENVRKVRELLGTIEPVTITSLRGGGEIGTGRRYESGVTKWKWLDGVEFFRTFELVDVPGVGFRLDNARLGKFTPNEVPLDPW